ncbi:hypothetical protein KI387_039053, partial [Taxus chinensis]
KFCRDLGGEIQMDWSHAMIPINGEMKKLMPEAQAKFIVTKTEDPRAQILFQGS